MKPTMSRFILGALMSMSAACAQADDQGPASRMPQVPELSGRIIIAGDSTAADYPLERAPQIGWGQVLDYYLPDDVEVINLAVNGRSTKSYVDEGRWDALIDEVGAGDIVLISFGHNDSRDDAPERYAAPEGAYRENLIGSHPTCRALAASLLFCPRQRAGFGKGPLWSKRTGYTGKMRLMLR